MNADLSTGERLDDSDGWLLRLSARDVAPTAVAMLLVVLMPSGLGLLLAVAVGVACALMLS